MLCASATINGAAFSRRLANPEMQFALVGKGRGQNGPALQVAWANQTDGLISQAIRRSPQGETTVNFDGLYERARERGWTLSKSTEAARYGTMPIRYILKDNHGLMYFRNLVDVESRLNTKAKQS
jgi:hypothetical protein